MFFDYMYVHLIHMINHVSRNNFQCISLKQQFEKLRCHYMGNCWYFLAPQETFSISLILMLIMTYFADIVLISIESMIGRGR